MYVKTQWNSLSCNLLFLGVTYVYLSSPRKIKQNTSIMEILSLEGYLVASPFNRSVVFNLRGDHDELHQNFQWRFSNYTQCSPSTPSPNASMPLRFWKVPQVTVNCFSSPNPQYRLWTTKRNLDAGHAVLNFFSERKLIILLRQTSFYSTLPCWASHLFYRFQGCAMLLRASLSAPFFQQHLFAHFMSLCHIW